MYMSPMILIVGITEQVLYRETDAERTESGGIPMAGMALEYPGDVPGGR
jgi:hypothetical protein